MSALFTLPILPQLNISSSLWAIAYALLALRLPLFLSFFLWCTYGNLSRLTPDKDAQG